MTKLTWHVKGLLIVAKANQTNQNTMQWHCWPLVFFSRMGWAPVAAAGPNVPVLACSDKCHAHTPRVLARSPIHGDKQKRSCEVRVPEIRTAHRAIAPSGPYVRM
jgi:hypothetical protein